MALIVFSKVFGRRQTVGSANLTLLFGKADNVSVFVFSESRKTISAASSRLITASVSTLSVLTIHFGAPLSRTFFTAGSTRGSSSKTTCPYKPRRSSFNKDAGANSPCGFSIVRLPSTKSVSPVLPKAFRTASAVLSGFSAFANSPVIA